MRVGGRKGLEAHRVEGFPAQAAVPPTGAAPSLAPRESVFERGQRSLPATYNYAARAPIADGNLGWTAQPPGKQYKAARWMRRIPQANGRRYDATFGRLFDVVGDVPMAAVSLALGAIAFNRMMVPDGLGGQTRMSTRNQLLAALAPVYEELIARGAISPLLERAARKQGRSEAMAHRLSDGIFALGHFIPGVGSPIEMFNRKAPLMALGGALLGKHANRSGLVRSMGVHALHNGLLTSSAVLAQKTQQPLLAALSLAVLIADTLGGVRVMMEEHQLEQTIEGLRNGWLSDPLVTPEVLSNWCKQLLSAKNTKGFDFRKGVEMSYLFGLYTFSHLSESARAQKAWEQTQAWLSETTPKKGDPAQRNQAAVQVLKELQ